MFVKPECQPVKAIFEIMGETERQVELYRMEIIIIAPPRPTFQYGDFSVHHEATFECDGNGWRCTCCPAEHAYSEYPNE